MKKLLLIFISGLMLSACGTYQETVQVDDKAYLLIIGEPQGCETTLDNATLLVLEKDTKAFDLNGRTATKIEIPRGTHEVKITCNGQLRVHRKFYVTNGNSFEVNL